MKPAFVYILSFTRTGIFYIGSTYDMKERLQRHIRELESGIHHNKILQDNWRFNDEYLLNVFEYPDRETAFKYEEEFIKSASIGPFNFLLANIGLHARAGDNLTRHPEKDDIVKRRTTKQKEVMSALSQNERKERFGRNGEKNGMWGKTHSEEIRKRISEHHKGHSYNVGIKLSPEHIEKIRARQRLRIGSKNSFFGKKHSEETRNKLRLLNSENSKTRREVSIDGVVYSSIRDAARKLNIMPSVIKYRVGVSKRPGWFFLEKTNSN